jgi:predicted GNAT family acetyltransferase
VNWKLAAARNINPLLDFLAPREYRAAAFASRLQYDSAVRLPPAKTASLWILPNQKEPESIRAAILLTEAGLYLPLFHETDSPAVEELDVFFRLCCKNRGKIYCLLGGDEDIVLSSEALARPVFAERTFDLMTLNKTAGAQPPVRIPHLLIRRIREAEADTFFPLDRDYQLEEVVTSPDRYNEFAGRLHFRQQCRSQLVFGAWMNGKPVAKAGTNAIGFRYCQVGGVYTEPAFRGRGIATAVMTRLLSAIASRGQHCTLFVRNDNPPAAALYRSLGFSRRCGYRISYPA